MAKKVCSLSELQANLAHYRLGYGTTKNKNAHSAKNTGGTGNALYQEGEKDALFNGRTEINLIDKDSVEARIVMRMRSVQRSSKFFDLDEPNQIRVLAEEGGRMCDELLDVGDFSPFSNETRRRLETEDPALLAATDAAIEAHKQGVSDLFADVKETETQRELQALKAEAARNKHLAEQVTIENERLKALTAPKS